MPAPSFHQVSLLEGLLGLNSLNKDAASERNRQQAKGLSTQSPESKDLGAVETAKAVKFQENQLDLFHWTFLSPLSHAPGRLWGLDRTASPRRGRRNFCPGPPRHCPKQILGTMDGADPEDSFFSCLLVCFGLGLGWLVVGWWLVGGCCGCGCCCCCCCCWCCCCCRPFLMFRLSAVGQHWAFSYMHSETCFKR